MDVLEKKLKKEVERMKDLEKPVRIIDENIKAIAEKFFDELRVKGLNDAIKPETIGIRSNKALRVMLDIVSDVTGIEKKDLLTYFLLRCFAEIWDNAPEPIKQYYRFKFKEIDEVYEIVKSLL